MTSRSRASLKTKGELIGTSMGERHGPLLSLGHWIIGFIVVYLTLTHIPGLSVDTVVDYCPKCGSYKKQ